MPCAPGPVSRCDRTGHITNEDESCIPYAPCPVSRCNRTGRITNESASCIPVLQVLSAGPTGQVA